MRITGEKKDITIVMLKMLASIPTLVWLT